MDSREVERLVSNKAIKLFKDYIVITLAVIIMDLGFMHLNSQIISRLESSVLR